DLAGWAARAGFGHVSLQGADEAMGLVARMQSATHELAMALTDKRSPGPGLAALDRVLRAVPGCLRVGPGGAAFVPDGPPLVQVVVRLALEAASFALGSEAGRLKRCARSEPECGRYFVDRSRDGRGRWCSPPCGTVERSRR